jgi:hypothetical protein
MSLMNVTRKYLKAYGFKEVFWKVVYYTTNKVINIYTLYKVKHSKYEFGLSNEKRKISIIVSLTSYPPRFKDMNLCLKSLLLQKVKPDKIIVYLGSDTTETDITQDMRKMEKYGIEYRIDSMLNLKPHKKYYYAMQEYPSAVVVTADDDIVYPSNWLKKLLQAHEKYPNAVCGWRVHKIEFDETGKMKPYAKWRSQYRGGNEPCMNIVATGCSGALYPSGALDKRAFDVDKIERLCINADDLWAKCMEVLKHTPVVWVKNYQVTLPGTSKEQETALNVDNVAGGMNDKQLHAVMEFYDMNSSMFR